MDPYAVGIHLISKQDHWQTAMPVLAAQETAEILLAGQLHMATPDTSCLSIQRSSWSYICLVAKAQDHGQVQCLIPGLIKLKRGQEMNCSTRGACRVAFTHA